MVDPGVITTVALAAVGGGIWLVRLEGRLNTHEAEDKLVHAHINEKLDDMKEDLKDLKTHFGVKGANGR